MSVNTKLYFVDRVSASQIANVIQREFKTTVDISDIKVSTPIGETDVLSTESGYIYFKTNGGENISLWWFQHNHVSGGFMDGTDFDTLSGSYSKETSDMLGKIAKYFGGYLCVCDSVDEFEYIDKTAYFFGEEIDERRMLLDTIRKHIGYKDCEKIMNMMERESELIVHYLSNIEY